MEGRESQVREMNREAENRPTNEESKEGNVKLFDLVMTWQ